MFIVELLKVIVIGIIEGITEWLPISSTGHMILFDSFVSLQVSDQFLEMFLVVIQLGAICAVPIIFWDRLWPLTVTDKKIAFKKETLALWSKVIVGVIPAAVIGLLIDDVIEPYLYNYLVVSIALIVYGIAFILVEKNRAEKQNKVEAAEDLGYADAFKIGAYQVLSLIPGTSRSGSSILGGMLSGVSRKASSEFSFFMAIPIVFGASGLKILKFILREFTATAQELVLLIVGMVVSFIVSVLVIKFLMDFVKRHSFKIFGYYRIALGAIVLIYFIVKSAF